MRIQLDELITISEPADLSACALAELRSIRDHLQDVENGLSYARRIVQGRLDTLTLELESRRDAPDGDLIERLSGALAGNSRGPGLPRPPRDLEPPAWADGLLLDLDQILPLAQLAELDRLEESELLTAIVRIGDFERELSAMRSEAHRRIDRVQDELVGRYRDGAAVDDLLT